MPYLNQRHRSLHQTVFWFIKATKLSYLVVALLFDAHFAFIFSNRLILKNFQKYLDFGAIFTKLQRVR